MARTLKSCVDCGLEFVGTKAQIRCQECKAKRERAYQLKYYYEHHPRASQTHIGDVMNCVDCGKEIIRASSRQLRCPECQKKHNLELAKERQRQLFQTDDEEQQKGRGPDSVAGLTLAEVQKRARELGLTYGRYMALVQSGGLEKYKRSRKTEEKGDDRTKMPAEELYEEEG